MAFEEKIKSSSVKIILTLTVIAAISGGILASVYSLTKDKIEYQKRQEKEKAIFSILPQTEYIDVKEVNSQIIYECKNKNNQVIGLAFTAEGPGYQDLIKVLVVTSDDLNEIKGMEVLESVETPGLGAKINENEFKNQFKNTSSALELSKEISGKSEEETIVQAITGATISSQAVVDIINAKIKQLKRLLQK